MAEHIAQPARRNAHFRYSTRDLLWFTAAVAVYVFALLQLIRWAVTGAAGPSEITVQFTIVILVGGALAALVWNADRQTTFKLGVNQIRWRRPCAWGTVFRLAFVCLLAALFVAPLPTSISVLVGLLLACATFFFVPIRVGNNGVSYQVGIFVPWSRYEVEYDSVNLALTFKDNRSDWSHRLTIPEIHRAAVEQILRENGKLPSR